MGLVDTILNVSKLESRELELNPSAENLGTLLGRSAEGMYFLLGDRRLTLLDPVPEVTVEGDAALVLRVLENLMSNAIAFTDSGEGIIEIRARAGNGVACVEVEDNGPGVPEEFRTHIFEKFSQIAGCRRSTGLGLAFCKLAVEAHGGEIGVKPGNGGGSIFWFTLRLTQA